MFWNPDVCTRRFRVPDRQDHVVGMVGMYVQYRAAFLEPEVLEDDFVKNPQADSRD